MTPQDELELEQMINRHGLKGVLATLADICDKRAEITAVKWQDTVAAKGWARYAVAVENAMLELWD